MVNAPHSSWDHHSYSIRNTQGDENEGSATETATSKVNVYSTSTTVEVEAAAALMSLPTFGSTSASSSKRTFSSLAQQQEDHNIGYESMVHPSEAPYYYASQEYSSQQPYHSGHAYPSQASQDHPSSTPRFQFADETTSQGSYAYGSRLSSYGSTSDSSSHIAASRSSTPRFQFGDNEQHVLQTTYASRRKASYCSSSDSSVGSGSYHHGEAAVVPPSSNAPRFLFAGESSSKSRRLDQHLGSYRSTKSCSSDSSSVSSTDSNSMFESSLSGPWFPGTTSLALEEDEEVLSPLHVFMRKHCVEAFSATAEDVATPRYGKSHGGKIVVGQVGIRCCHCKTRPIKERPERAVCFPSSLKNIYHSIETWQRRHSGFCTDMPPAIKQELNQLMQNSRSSAGGRRQYWQDAAKRLGLADTPCGVRFIRPPGLAVDDSNSSSLNATSRESSSSRLSSVQDSTMIDKAFICQPLVTEEDRPLVTEHLFLLMSQMESCRFSEEDRTGGRSKVKAQDVGFPGMQCRHCHGKAGFGRYFPQSAQALALANSDRNICNHVLKCRKCPSDTKELLLLLQERQQGTSGPMKKNKRGSRKQFFARVWKRLHGPSQEDDASSAISQENHHESTTSLSSAASSMVAATAQSFANTWFVTDDDC